MKSSTVCLATFVLAMQSMACEVGYPDEQVDGSGDSLDAGVVPQAGDEFCYFPIPGAADGSGHLDPASEVCITVPSKNVEPLPKYTGTPFFVGRMGNLFCYHYEADLIPQYEQYCSTLERFGVQYDFILPEPSAGSTAFKATLTDSTGQKGLSFGVVDVQADRFFLGDARVIFFVSNDTPDPIVYTAYYTCKHKSGFFFSLNPDGTMNKTSPFFRTLANTAIARTPTRYTYRYVGCGPEATELHVHSYIQDRTLLPDATWQRRQQAFDARTGSHLLSPGSESYPLGVYDEI